MEFKKYKIKGKVFSFFGEYTISDEGDNLCYTAKSNFLQTKMPLINSMDEEVLMIRRKLFAFRYSFFIEKDGQPIFRVVKSFGFKPQIIIESLIEPDAFVVQGNIWATEYAFYRENKEFAFVSHKIFSIRGLYGLALDPAEDEQLVIALVLIIDLIKKAKRRRRSN